METILYICLIFSLFFSSFYILILHSRVHHKNLPSTPPRLPIIGHFHLLKSPLPQALQNLSNRYGAILFLRLGSRPALVVSTVSGVEHCFTKNDIVFANRPLFASKKQLEYNFTSLGAAPYGNHWRNLRRFSVIEIFSSSRIQMSSSVRTDEVRYFIKHLVGNGAKKVDVKPFFYMLSFNIMMKMVSGNRYFEGDELDSEKNRHKLGDIKQSFSPTTTMALSDFFPFLKWSTFLGVARKNRRVHKRRDVFMQALIDARKDNRSSSSSSSSSSCSVMEGEKMKTIIDVMLSLQESEPEFYTEGVIKGIVQTMLIAGTETSAMTMESAASFLISHPNVLNKARDEIDTNVEHSRLLEDGDLAKLPYLHCILKETLRLGPTVPIIPPHESSEECLVGGFNVPRGTMLMVNTSALHTDPELWDEPTVFKPERFKSSEAEKGGFRFIPFGTGRRQCPGASLAMRLMALALGTLIQCFNWEKAEECCMDVSKDKLAEIIFQPREAFINALSQL